MRRFGMLGCILVSLNSLGTVSLRTLFLAKKTPLFRTSGFRIIARPDREVVLDCPYDLICSIVL
jgi:hypothetical protein